MLQCIRAGDLAVEVVVYATFSLVTEFVKQQSDLGESLAPPDEKDY